MREKQLLCSQFLVFTDVTWQHATPPIPYKKCLLRLWILRSKENIQVSNQAEIWISSFDRGDAATIAFMVIW